MSQPTYTRTSAPSAALCVATAVAVAALTLGLPSQADAQEEVDDQRAIELETIEIEAEVPRRVAQFFVQRDQLQYEEMDDQPSFMPELMESVEKEPF